MKVRTKLIIGCIVGTVLIWVITIYGGYNIADLSQRFGTVEEEIIANSAVMDELEILYNDIHYSVTEYVFNDIEESKNSALSQLDYLKEIGTQYLPESAMIRENDNGKDVVLAGKIFDFYFASSWIINLKDDGGQPEQLQARYFDMVLPALLALQQQISETELVSVATISEIKADVARSYSNSTQSLYHSAALISILAVIAAIFIIRSIVKPLSALRRGTEVIARGNLNHKVDTGTNDEIGQLSRAFDRMTKSLSTSMTSIDNLNKEIAERKQAEEALRESEEKFSKAFRSSPNSIAITTLEDGIFQEVNDGFTREYGYTRDELIGHSSKKLGMWAEPRERERILRKLRKEGQVLNEVFATRVKSGALRSMTFSAEPINLGGKSCIIAATADITESKKTEQLQRDENYVLTLLSQGAELNEILDAIVKLGEAHDPAIKGSIMLYDESRELLMPVSFRSLPDDYTTLLKEGLPVGPNVGTCGTAAYRRERVVVPDIENSELFEPFPEAIEKSIANNLHACWSDPIISSTGEVLGTIANYRDRVGEPDEGNLRVLEWSARIAAIAIESKRAEEELKINEERFRLLADNSTDLIARLQIQPEVKTDYISPSSTRITGYTPEEFYADSSLGLSILHPDDKESFLKELAGNREKQPKPRMLRLVRKDGRVIWGELTTTTIFNEKGEPTAVHVIVHDITERKEAEEALSNEAVRRRIFIEQSQDGIVVIDREGKVYEANQRFAEMLGYSMEEVYQLGVWDWEAAFPKEQVAEMLRTVDESGDHFETKHVRKDGSLYDVEISTTAAVFEGQKLIFCVCRDITERKEAEQALRQSEERYRDLFDNARELIQSVAPDGSFVYVNQAWKNVLGYSDEEIKDLQVWDIIHPDARPHCQDVFGRMMSGETFDSMETTFVAKDGRLIQVEGDVTVQYSDDKIVATRGIFRDITERKEMQEALQSNEERFRLLADHSTDLIARYQVSPEVRTDYVSPSSTRITGYSPEEFYDDLGLAVRMIHPDDREFFVKELMPGNKSEKSINARLIRKDGKVIWVELTQVTIFNENGEPTAVHLVARDITESKEMQEALQSSEERFRLLADHSTDFISRIQVTPEVRTDYVSPSSTRITGYTPEEFYNDMGLGLRIIHPDDRELFIENLKPGAKDGKLTAVRLIRKDDKVIWIEGTQVTIYDENGKPSAVHLVARDITERKKAEEALKLSEEKFSKVFRSSPLQIILTRVKDDVTLDVNDSYCKSSGFTRKETVGRTAAEMGIFVDPDQSKKIDALIKKKGRIYNEEFQFRRKSGEIQTELVSAELINIGGEECLLSTMVDITKRKEMEEALRESEEKFSKVFRSSPQIIAIFRVSDQRFIEVNDSFLRITGYKRDEVVNVANAEKNLWADQKQRKKIIEKLMKNRKIHDEEIKMRMKNGEIRTMLFSVETINIGQEPCGITIITDITQMREMVDALRLSDAAFKSIREGIIVVEPDLTITRWNKVSEQLLGIKASEAIGKKFTDFIEVVEEHPGHMEERLKLLEKQGYHQEEQRYRTRNGDSWVDSHVQEIIGDGKHYGRVILFTDITPRKKAEEALRESEEKFYKAFHASPEAITISNIKDGKFLEVNESYTRITGYSREEVLGHDATEFNMWVNEEDQEKMLEKIRNNTVMHNEEFQFRTKSGEILTLLFSSEYVQIHGEPCLLAVSTDITERKKAEEELKLAGERLAATNKELEAFSYSVSHDLRSPLRSIDGFSQALIEDYTDTLDDNGKDYLQRLRGASQKMGELIDGLLKLSRLTRSEMHVENVNLSQLAREITDRLKETQPERKAKFIISKDLTANGDPQLLRVLFENLLSNAWKFSRNVSPAKIEFGLAENGEKMTYYVKDNGAGFDMKFSDKLFGAFQRLHDSKDYPGTGIGLATVRRIINRHGGNIWAESAVGKGATFFFTLN